MKNKYIKFLFLLFIIMSSLFASENKVPNQLIVDNPQKEVTTIESKKNRDHAKLSLSITKTSAEPLMGRKINSEMIIYLPIKIQEGWTIKAFGQSESLDTNLKLPKDLDLPPEMKRKNPSVEKNIELKEIIEDKEKIQIIRVLNVKNNEKIFIQIFDNNKIKYAYKIQDITPFFIINGPECWGITYKSPPMKKIERSVSKTVNINDLTSPINLTFEEDTLIQNIQNYTLDNNWSRVRRAYYRYDGYGSGFKINTSNYWARLQDDFFSDKNSSSPQKALVLQLEQNKRQYGFNLDIEHTGNEGELNEPIHNALYYPNTILWDGTKIEPPNGSAPYLANKRRNIIPEYYNYRAEKIQELDVFETYVTNYAVGGGYKCTDTVGRERGSLRAQLKDIKLTFRNLNTRFESTNLKTPGRYLFPITLVFEKYDNTKHLEIKTNYIIDVIDNNIKSVEINGDNATQAFTIIYPEEKFSSMVKNIDSVNNDIGLFYKGPNNELQKLIPNTDGIIITSNNKRARLKLEQLDNEFAIVTLIREGNQVGDATFEFSILQKSGNIIYQQKKIKVITKGLNQSVGIGNVTLTVDPRLGQNKNFGKEADANNAANLRWIRISKKSYTNAVESEAAVYDYINKFFVIDSQDHSQLKNYNDYASFKVGVKGDDGYIADRTTSGAWLYKNKNGDYTFGADATADLNFRPEKVINDFLIGVRPKSSNSNYINSNITTYIISARKAETVQNLEYEVRMNIKDDNVPITGYNGSGILDIAQLESNKTYSFQLTGHGQGTGISNEDSKVKFESLIGNLVDGRSLFSNNNIVTDIQLSNNIQGISIKINKKGELELTKTGEINIGIDGSETKLQYFHTPSGNRFQKLMKIKLGEFNFKFIDTTKIEDLGIATFKIDRRVQQNTYNNWIFSDGTVTNTLEGHGTTKVYNDLVSFEGFSKLDNLKTNNEISSGNNLVEGRIFDKKIGGNGSFYDRFLKEGKGWEEEVALPVGIPIKKYNEKLVISKINSNKLTGEDTNFLLTTNERNIFYKGIIKEKYIGENLWYEGSANINLLKAEIGRIYKFSPDIMLKNLNSQGLNLELVSGKPLDSRSAINLNSGNIATWIKITVDKDGQEITTPFIDEKLISEKVYSIPQLGIGIGISQEGGLLVQKIKENIFFQSTMIRIEYFYDKKSKTEQGIKLGEFYINFRNEKIDLTDTTIKIDSRLRNKSAIGDWIKLHTKELFQDLNRNNIARYSDLIEVYNLPNQSINVETIIDMPNRNFKRGKTGNYEKFTPTNSSWSDEGALPVSNSFANQAVISIGNSDNIELLNNHYRFIGTDGKLYIGNIKEEYLGNSDPILGSGVVDLSSAQDGMAYIFPIHNSNNTNLIEGVSNNGEKIILTLDSIDGNNNLPNGLSRIFPTKNIANKISVIENNMTFTKSNNIKLQNNKLTFGISSNGGLTISKNGEIQEGKYIIEFLYSPEPQNSQKLEKDIVLSRFNLKVETLKKLGTIKFEIDNRLKKFSNSWINANGVIFETTSQTSDRIYSEFLEAKFIQEDSHQINNNEKVIDIIKINDNLPNVSENYKWLKSNNDIFALPYNTTLNHYTLQDKSKMIVSIGEMTTKNSNQNKNTSSTAIFEIKTSTQKRYEGKLEEIYVGPIAPFKGIGHVNITNIEPGIGQIFNASQENIKNTKVGKVITSNLGLPITYSGDFIDSTGKVSSQKGKNIANKIKIKNLKTFDNKSDEKISINNLMATIANSITVGIDKETGNFLLRKEHDERVGNISFSIEYYYEPNISSQEVTNDAIKLGEFTLYIEDSYFEVLGSNVLDFGNMTYSNNNKWTATNIFTITNPSNKEIEVSLKNEEKELYMSSSNMEVNSNAKIPYKIDKIKELTNNNKITKFEITATADTSSNPPPGKYEGDFTIIVNIRSNESSK